MHTNNYNEEVYDSIRQGLNIDHNSLSIAIKMEYKSWSSKIHDLLQEKCEPYRTLAVELARQLPVEHSVNVKLDHCRWADYEFPSELKEHIEKNIDEKTVQYLIDILKGEYKKNENDWDLIESTLEFLDEVRLPGALDDLLRLLEDPEIDWAIQPKLIRIIGKYRDSKAIMPLIRQIRKDNELSNDVVWALGQIENPKVTPLLLKLSKSKSESLRLNVFQALGEIKDPRSIKRLSERFKERPREVAERREIAATLMKFGDMNILSLFLDWYLET
jgi:HEAT repeat protein